jgi:hypothetical protein
MTADELRIAQGKHEVAQQEARRAQEYRNLTIQQALAEGWTHARIAEATGLTRGRIGQLA